MPGTGSGGIKECKEEQDLASFSWASSTLNFNKLHLVFSMTYTDVILHNALILHTLCTRTQQFTWGVQVLRSPNFFLGGMEADRNVKVVGGDVAVL